MKNYLKFVIVVFAVTVALFGSIGVDAKGKSAGSCDDKPKSCGTTSNGDPIVGEYS